MVNSTWLQQRLFEPGMGLAAIGLAIVLFLIFEPDGLVHRWHLITTYWRPLSVFLLTAAKTQLQMTR